ncbi:putative APT1-adenine phosphoribosyltransferase [Meira miltonrushii]|uniref:adenine phosphoribosyltransferase n=1 Tax=Meira miltonrushii TaxID=1280837 RepID=A0A316V7M3_9BASI|nr:putative APT1-adenine phosphoribosyltransferase [Meira miltonrushii]PWN33500.1 putative APT1-adenine phosphoribosyltransferase [Meira miltonrushii]
MHRTRSVSSIFDLIHHFESFKMSNYTTADENAADIALLKSKFAFHQDFPKKGIYFCDVFPAFRDPLTLELLITHFVSHIFNVTIPKLAKGGKIDTVVGLDARGFLIGPIIASRLGAAFVPVRKAGKLPGKCAKASYAKEYGEDVFEIQSDSIAKGANVIVVDDLIATGGSAKAAGELVQQLGAKTLEYLFIVGGSNLNGAAKLDAPAYSLVDIEL